MLRKPIAVPIRSAAFSRQGLEKAQRPGRPLQERTVDLDGQITSFGATIIGRWKMRKRRPPVLLKAVAGKTFANSQYRPPDIIVPAGNASSHAIAMLRTAPNCSPEPLAAS
jgi:hypothetical protein